MRISKAPNATPHSTPPSSLGSQGEAGAWREDERYIWTSLVPRLIDPAKLTVVKALIQAREPQSIDDLVREAEPGGDPREIERHMSDMVDAGALEVVSTQVGAGDEAPLYFFARER